MDERGGIPPEGAAEKLIEALNAAALEVAEHAEPRDDPLRAPEPLMQRVERDSRTRMIAKPAIATVLALLIVVFLGISLRGFVSALPRVTSSPGGGVSVAVDGIPCPGPTLLISIALSGLLYLMFAPEKIGRTFDILGAVPASPGDLKRVREAIDDMSIAFGLSRRPGLYVVETPAVNAFIVGRRLEGSVVGVTRGLAEAMPADELRAVVAQLLARRSIGRAPEASGGPTLDEQADALAMQTLRDPHALLSALERIRSSDGLWTPKGSGPIAACFFAPLMFGGVFTQYAVDQRIARLRAVVGAEGAG